MFVKPRRLKAQGAVAATLASFALVGCDDPIATTDLRPEGEPEVLSVLVMNDSAEKFFETATYCAVNDDKRPGFVGTPHGGTVLCDPDLTVPAEPVSDATSGGAEPTSWYVRVQFDELLDPDAVEELAPILDDDGNETGQFTGTLVNTQPVILTCGGQPVDYDGYYSPSGNSVTWPVGPSLFVQPTDPTVVATGSECSLQLKGDVIVDKDGVGVPDAQLGAAGEYVWELTALQFINSSPKPAAKVCSVTTSDTCKADDDCEAGETCQFDLPKIPKVTADSPVKLTFNGFIDVDTLAATEVTITEQNSCMDATGAVARTAIVEQATDAMGMPLKTVLAVRIAGTATTCGAMGNTACAFTANKSYLITFTADNAVTDLAGGPGALPAAEDFTLCIDAVPPPAPSA